MRVAILTSTPTSPTEGSGTWVALAGLVDGLGQLGHAVEVRALGRRTGFHTLDRWRYNVELARRPPTADLVVGVDLDGFLWARRRARPRFVVALKGIIADELRNERGLVRALLALQARWERRNVARADRVLVPSRYSADVAAAVYGVPPGRIGVVPEPVDVARWQAELAALAPARGPRPTVLAVARMYPRKRLTDLLAAAERLRGRVPGLAVRIVGSGPEAGRLAAERRARGLAGTVELLGDVSRRALAVEYASAHCFCLPTVQEGFGIVFVEAMAAGLPVVACRAAAVPELVEDGRTGLLVAPRDPEALADALARVLGEPGLAERLGAEGRRRAVRFEPREVAAAFLAAAGA